jgi:hypothetical protein
VRALRIEAGATLEQFAIAAKAFGLPWSTGRVGDFEAGRVAPSFPTMYAVALALRTVTGQPVALADLLAGDDGPVDLTDELTIDLSDLQGALQGKPVAGGERKPTARDKGNLGRGLASLVPDWFHLEMREADVRLCKQLGVTPERGGAAMIALWRRSFTNERDRRAGADANAQRKGQISRQLKTELKLQLEGN